MAYPKQQEEFTLDVFGLVEDRDPLIIARIKALAMLVVSAMPWKELAAETAPLAAIVESRWGRTGVLLVGLAALFSTSNTLLSNMLGSSRVLAYMGREVAPLRWLGHVSAKRSTRIRAASGRAMRLGTLYHGSGRKHPDLGTSFHALP